VHPLKVPLHIPLIALGHTMLAYVIRVAKYRGQTVKETLTVRTRCTMYSGFDITIRAVVGQTDK